MSSMFFSAARVPPVRSTRTGWDEDLIGRDERVDGEQPQTGGSRSDVIQTFLTAFCRTLDVGSQGPLHPGLTATRDTSSISAPPDQSLRHTHKLGTSTHSCTQSMIGFPSTKTS